MKLTDAKIINALKAGKRITSNDTSWRIADEDK